MKVVEPRGPPYLTTEMVQVRTLGNHQEFPQDVWGPLNPRTKEKFKSQNSILQSMEEKLLG